MSLEYPPVAYDLVRKTLEKKRTSDFGEIFMELQKVIREKKKKSPFTYMNNTMRIYTTSDLQNIINNINNSPTNRWINRFHP